MYYVDDAYFDMQIKIPFWLENCSSGSIGCVRVWRCVCAHVYVCVCVVGVFVVCWCVLVCGVRLSVFVMACDGEEVWRMVSASVSFCLGAEEKQEFSFLRKIKFQKNCVHHGLR